ncbi:hypothetical protein C8R45DRAFT_1215210 [Mycena sanguinolenta]|nr:hypothetical protein C8R45DRAFT_1215210 [Mycena sanguinolenta]
MPITLQTNIKSQWALKNIFRISKRIIPTPSTLSPKDTPDRAPCRVGNSAVRNTCARLEVPHRPPQLHSSPPQRAQGCIPSSSSILVRSRVPSSTPIPTLSCWQMADATAQRLRHPRRPPLIVLGIVVVAHPVGRIRLIPFHPQARVQRPSSMSRGTPTPSSASRIVRRIPMHVHIRSRDPHSSTDSRDASQPTMSHNVARKHHPPRRAIPVTAAALLATTDARYRRLEVRHRRPQRAVRPHSLSPSPPPSAATPGTRHRSAATPQHSSSTCTIPASRVRHRPRPLFATRAAVRPHPPSPYSCTHRRPRALPRPQLQLHTAPILAVRRIPAVHTARRVSSPSCRATVSPAARAARHPRLEVRHPPRGATTQLVLRTARRSPLSPRGMPCPPRDPHCARLAPSNARHRRLEVRQPVPAFESRGASAWYTPSRYSPPTPAHRGPSAAAACAEPPPDAWARHR